MIALCLIFCLGCLILRFPLGGGEVEKRRQKRVSFSIWAAGRRCLPGRQLNMLGRKTANLPCQCSCPPKPEPKRASDRGERRGVRGGLEARPKQAPKTGVRLQNRELRITIKTRVTCMGTSAPTFSMPTSLVAQRAVAAKAGLHCQCSCPPKPAKGRRREWEKHEGPVQEGGSRWGQGNPFVRAKGPKGVGRGGKGEGGTKTGMEDRPERKRILTIRLPAVCRIPEYQTCGL